MNQWEWYKPIKTMAEKKTKDKINKAYEKEKRKYVIFTIN
jgi:hypothetical protein